MEFLGISNAIKLFFHNNYQFRCDLIDKLRMLGMLNWLPDDSFIKLVYRIHFNRHINLKKPESFNEKLNWLKLNYRHSIQSRMVDKCEAKAYVQEMIGEQYIIKNYGVWNSFDDIDFDQLPNKFVLKCTHDSGSIVICKDKANFDRLCARERITQSMNKNLFWWGREWPYKNVKPRILAEEFLEDSSDNDLKDYKFFCFNGKVKCYKIDFGRFTCHKANYYSPDGELLDISEVVCQSDPTHNIEIPTTINTMIQLAEELSKGFPFLRVDFYSVNNNIYFGELTFYPAAALSPFTKYESDLMLGQYLTLPNLNTV